MDQPIRSRVASEEYRKNWDAVFGNQVDPEAEELRSDVGPMDGDEMMPVKSDG